MPKAGCLSLPSTVTRSIQCEGRLTLTRHPDGCVMLFPRPVWEQHRQQISSWPMQARAWQRIFLGYATDVEMDTAGRILIAPELRAAVGLDKEVMMMGMGSHFEIWDAAKMAEKEQQALEAGTPMYSLISLSKAPSHDHDNGA
jgi:MraZ protein